jgi:DegV family protein with EDD domain
MPLTAQINAYMFENAFESDLKNGDDIIYLGFSSGLSGTFNSSRIAKDTLAAKYPSQSIEVIDTLSASVGLAAIIFEVLDFVKEGKDVEFIYNWVESNKLNFNHWFGVDNLEFLKNGGRISSTAAFVGNVFSLKPTLVVDREGKLKAHTNVRGRKKSITFLSTKVKENIQNPSTSRVVIGHGNNLSDALKLKAAIEDLVCVKEIYLTELSMTIASHVGPDMLAVAFLGSKRD